MPEVDQGKCNGCGLCISVCSCHALMLVEDVITVVEIEDCGGCLECEVVCPTGAIAFSFEIVVEED